MNEVYERLAKWAAKNNMQFKVSCDDGRSIDVWMCDAADGYCGAECVTINIQPDDEYYMQPYWHRFRFVLKKNERFIGMFVRNGVFEDTHEQWLGGHDPEPLFVMPRWYHCRSIEWHGVKGSAYYLEKEPADATRDEIIAAGCELLLVSPYYAQEIKHQVVFVPKGTPFADSTIYGTKWYGRETIGEVA